MIPKQLFFIWFGDTKPKYIDYSIQNFKNINKDFKIIFLNYTVKNIENISEGNIQLEYDYVLYNCINYILDNNKYQKTIDKNKKNGRRFLQILCNIYKLELLSKYGGIYLDCDTFPLKPFDDKLLKNKSFCTAYTDKNNLFKDSYFLGSCGQGFYHDNYGAMNIALEGFNPKDRDLQWYKNKELFFDCLLEYKQDISCKYYVQHYWDFTCNPNNCKTPICKYDKI